MQKEEPKYATTGAFAMLHILVLVVFGCSMFLYKDVNEKTEKLQKRVEELENRIRDPK